MRIGIITIIDYLNYGNRLQNYAVQEVLKALGTEVDTIKNNPGSFNKTEVTGSINKLLMQDNLIKTLQLVQRKIIHEITKKRVDLLEAKKTMNFKKFSDELIEESKFNINGIEIPNGIVEEYDFFIVGSDQVWNPHHRRGYPIDFLEFAPVHKRIAYAPSFGVAELPDNYVKKYKELLLKMDRISVREEAGAKIIKELTGKDAEVLIDPTLMLDKDRWLSISKDSVNRPRKGYVLTYFLGKQNKSTIKKINKHAIDNNLEIVNLANINHEKYYTIDPSEFINFIHHSNILFTDSFHGVVFSILLEKPFIVFKRGKMNARIDNLLSKFKLEQRKWEEIFESDDLYRIDYSHVPEILAREREKALKYLKIALYIKEEEN